MQLDWSQTGRLDVAQKKVTDFLDTQVFAYPAYAIQISGVRAGIVGTLQGVSRDSYVTLSGSLDCDGSMINAVSNIEVIVSA